MIDALGKHNQTWAFQKTGMKEVANELLRYHWASGLNTDHELTD
jgi:hypothetical protein